MYVIYDNGEHSPFVVAAKNLLKCLNIEFSTDSKGGLDIGYHARISKLECFLLSTIYHLALAQKNNKILLTLDEDSYCNLAFCVNMIENNQNLKKFIHDSFSKKNIEIDIENLKNHLEFLPRLLYKNIGRVRENIKFKLHGLSACLYYGYRHFDCSRNGEYDGLPLIFDLVGLKYFDMPFGKYCFSHLIDIDPILCYKKSGEVMFSGIDLGVDFLCSFSDSVFNLFDSKHNLCVKHFKRDDITISTLNLSQILLLAFGRFNETAFNTHKIKPDFLDSSNILVS